MHSPSHPLMPWFQLGGFLHCSAHADDKHVESFNLKLCGGKNLLLCAWVSLMHLVLHCRFILETYLPVLWLFRWGALITRTHVLLACIFLSIWWGRLSPGCLWGWALTCPLCTENVDKVRGRHFSSDTVSSTVLPVIGLGFSSGRSLLSQWPFYPWGFWGLWVYVWDFGISHSLAAGMEHQNVQGYRWTVTRVYVKQSGCHCGCIRSSPLVCVIHSIHIHLSLRCSGQRWKFLGLKTSLPVWLWEPKPFNGSWCNLFRKEWGCHRFAFVWLWSWRPALPGWTSVQTDSLPSEKIPWKNLPYFCSCFSTFQDTRRSFHRSIRAHTTDCTSRTPHACHVQVAFPGVKQLSKLLLNPQKILWQHCTQSHRTDVLGMTVTKRLGNKEQGSWNLLQRTWRKSLSVTIHISAFSSFFVWQIVFYLQPAHFNAFSLPQPTGSLFSPSDNVTIWFYYSEIPKHVLQPYWKIIRCCCGVKAHLWSMAPSGN